MQLGDNIQITSQMLTDGRERDFVLESFATAPTTPLEYLIFSWEQFVNELEFE